MLAYLQKPAVQMALFGAAVAGAAAFFFLQDGEKSGPAKTTTPPKGMGQASTETVQRGRTETKTSETGETAHLDKLVLPPAKPEPPTVVKEPPKPQEKPKPLVFPNLVQLSQSLKASPFSPQPPQIFAPRGTLIKAALVITLESNAVGTPVLGMVTEDVYFQGNLIVPAGTQVQASAAGGSNIRDRIDIRGTFTFIWTDGSEYSINGIALDHEPLPDGTFALTDGSPGVKGRILKTDDYAEFKLLVAEAVKGLLLNNQSQYQTIYGLAPENTNRNAALGSGSSAAGAYAGLLSKKIEKDLEYVQVPAGTSFYIYTLDVFEPELRSIAGIRQGNKPKTGLDEQMENHEKVVGQIAASEQNLSARIESAREADAAASKAQQKTEQIERTRQLLNPTSGRPVARPPSASRP